MTADDLCVADKATKECNSGVAVQFGTKLQGVPRSLPSNTMMVQQVMNHHRSLPSDGLGVSHGPTGEFIRSVSNNIYDVVGDGAHGVNVSGCGGAVGVRTLQPFLDISPTAFNSSPGSMAASFGFPFTNAQWKELERQAVVYKYLMASVPVPPYLLTPTPESLSSGRMPTYAPNLLGRALNPRFTNGADLEPGRCRRTDGKKWRCSRDVAPDQKYCERHMNRGRPRSRKPVEVHANNKKARHNVATCAESPVNPIVNCGATASHQFVGPLSRPCLQSPTFLDKWSDSVGKFNASDDAFISSYREPRNLDRVMKGQTVPVAARTDKQWHHLVETKTGLVTDSSFTASPILSQHHLETPSNLSSLGNYSSAEDQPRTDQCTLFLEQTPRGFIDAWSIGVSNDHNRNSRNTHPLSSNGKPCPSSLTLSMGCNDTMDDNNEMGQIQMGLGLVVSDQNHECAAATTTTPGGPLAEALQLTTLSTTVSQSSSDSPRRITVSSPCGVLQKTLASVSDSSDNSSPTSRSQT